MATQSLSHSQLHGVHERALHAVEYHHAYGQQHRHEGEAVAQHAPAELAGTEEAVLESLDDGRQRVERHQEVQFGIGDGTQGPHHRRGVHPEADEVAQQQRQVAVLGGHAREEDAEAQRQAGQHQHQHRQQQGVEVGGYLTWDDPYLVDGVDNQEEHELYAETQQVAHHVGDRHYHAREVDLAEDARVGGEGVGGLGEAVAEILPQADAAEVEERLRQAVGGDLGDATEDHHIHHHGDERLYDIPCRSEDGLLVLCGDVAADEEAAQVAVAPKLLEVNLQQFLLRLYDGGPTFG